MRKLLSIVVVAFLSFTTGHSQGVFDIGAGGGFPVFDASDFSNFAFNIDAAYLFEVAEDIEVGPSVSYLHFVGSSEEISIAPLGTTTINYDDVAFLPIAGQAKWEFAEEWRIRLEVGYAIGASSGNDGGFYWSPGVSYEVVDDLEIVGTLRVVAENSFSWGTINFGVTYTFDNDDDEDDD